MSRLASGFRACGRCDGRCVVDCPLAPRSAERAHDACRRCHGERIVNCPTCGGEGVVRDEAAADTCPRVAQHGAGACPEGCGR